MIGLPRLLRRLSRDRRGAATIEFALWSGLFFLGMLTALDFAMYRTQQLRLGSAIEQGGVLAFNARAALDNTAAESIRTYVQQASRVAGGALPDVTVTCNNNQTCTGTSRQCVCMSTAANGTTSYANAASCGASCSGNTTAGYYLSIHASHAYSSVVLPRDMLNGRTMGKTVIVRLQ